ncbi:MAG: hypothetical protein KatS3mg110_0797 [Pirellulaceae bacterium]|nr:MAG: hypothetical protein KatS3mg110_0797 [Pirellulaceae bacterium]
MTGVSLSGDNAEFFLAVRRPNGWLIVSMCLVAVWLSGLVGCGRPAATGGGANSQPASATADQATTEGDSAGNTTPEPQTAYHEPRVARWQEIEQWIGQQKGKPVIVDFWSTTCGPCLRELPHLVKLNEELAGKVVCATVDLDYYGDPESPPASLVPQVSQVLQRLGARTENFVCADADSEVLAKLQAASIPVVLVYDADGNLAKKFTNDANEYGQEGFTYEKHIIPLVRKLLEP